MTVSCHKNGVKHKRQVSLKAANKPHYRFSTPDYSVQSLSDQMNSFIQKVGAKGALDLQSYRNIKLSCAVSGRGILQNKALVQVLINVCPYALYKVTDLKLCFVETAHEFDELTGALPKSTDRWAGYIRKRGFEPKMNCWPIHPRNLYPTLWNWLFKLVHSKIYTNNFEISSFKVLYQKNIIKTLI